MASFSWYCARKQRQGLRLQENRKGHLMCSINPLCKSEAKGTRWVRGWGGQWGIGIRSREGRREERNWQEAISRMCRDPDWERGAEVGREGVYGGD